MSAPATITPSDVRLVCAEDYAARGWPVFPLHAVQDGRCTCGKADCQSPGKHPRPPRGLLDASTDADTIRQWWAKWPDANVGIVTGAASGLFVLDVDPGHGGDTSLADLLAVHGPLPETVESLTGGGGRHIFFKHPGGTIRNSAGKLGPGLDVRGDGGYIVAPPSVHVSGGCYQWTADPGETPLTEAPAWLLARLRDETPRPAGAPDSDRIPKNRRNNTLTSLAGAMRRKGATETAILAALQAENRNRCDPPLSDSEVAGIAASIGHYAPAVEDDVNIEGDVRLGRAFAAASYKRVRYCPDLESWLVWDGRRWEPDAVHAAERLMQDLARDCLAAAANVNDSKAREIEVRFWVQAMRRNRIEAALWAARSDPRLIVRLADLDRDPWLLNTLNGTLNLKTGRLRRHDPADLITKLAPAEYRPDADQREWLRFLERVIPDPADRAFLRRATGYSLTGFATEEVLFFVCGPARGGKSTFILAVSSTLGDYAATANFATFLAQRNKSGPRPDIVRLAGKRFVSSIETEEAAQLAGGLLKWITGQDKLCERGLYTTEIEFLPTFTLWLVSNFKPKAQDDDSALWSRLMLLPFPVTIPEAERDPNVKARLRDPAIGGPAVLAWAVEGCRKWQKNGLQPPPTVLAATRQWRAENDPLADWIAERADLDPPAATTFKALNADYRAWAVENGLRPISGKKLAERLVLTLGCRKPTDRNRTYEGIALKDG